MTLSRILFVMMIFIFFFPLSAVSQVECSGTLTQKNFYREIKDLNGKIQKNVLEYRKLEQQQAKQAANSAEAKETQKRMSELMSTLQEQKKTFQELNSPYFPTTQLTALGAACGDFRWVERGKDILIKRPDQLGKSYFVWMDKTSREIKASEDRPSLDVVAK
jgi:hypothetical protein